MKLKEQILKLLHNNLPDLRKRFNIKTLGIFGSYSRDEQNNESDLDILVEFDVVPSFFQYIDIETYLSDMLGEKVDLVMKDALKPIIAPIILKEIIYVK